MTPKQRSAHRNAQRSRLKGRMRILVYDSRCLLQVPTYDQLVTQYALTGRAMYCVSRDPDGMWHIAFPTAHPFS